MVVSHLKLNIFTVAFTFHGPRISNKDLEIRYHPQKVMNNFCDSLMDKVMSVATIDQYHYWSMFNKALDFESLR